MKKISLTALLFIFIGESTVAQQSDTSPPADSSQIVTVDTLSNIPEPTKKKSWNFSGDFGVYGEVYSVNGAEERRPSSSARMFFRPSFTLFGNLGTSLDIVLSTEGNSARQQINSFSAHPKWDWGTLHLGDFSHLFSNYTLKGVTMRGAGIELNPGVFRLHVVGGRTKRAVEAGPTTSVYAQDLLGVKLGIGREGSSFIDINVVRVEDDPNSLPIEIFMIDSIDVDTTAAGDTLRQVGVTPQENLVVGANSRFSFMQNKLNFTGEFSGSANNRNSESEEFFSEEIPSEVEDVFTPTVSSSFDYAYTGEVALKTKTFDAHGGYSYVGPGYVSLGVTSLMNDRKEIDAGLGLRLARGRVTFQGTYTAQEDNLADQKLYTTTRTTYRFNATTRPVNQVSLVFNMMHNIMENDATLDSAVVDNIASSYSGTGMYQFFLFRLNQSLTLNYTIQFTEDNNILRTGSDVTSQNITVSLMSTLSRSWSLAASTNLNTVDVENQGETDRKNYTAILNNRMFDSRMSNSFGVGLSTSDITDVTTLTLQSEITVAASDAIRLAVK
ncbi:MAG: hypothetical protein KAU36_02420, partial [candidate division Zixibacteria bacterium]|nr:hypothetical protein [candidate division Zixibacteria bacterium]